MTPSETRTTIARLWSAFAQAREPDMDSAEVAADALDEEGYPKLAADIRRLVHGFRGNAFRALDRVKIRSLDRRVGRALDEIAYGRIEPVVWWWTYHTNRLVQIPVWVLQKIPKTGPGTVDALRVRPLSRSNRFGYGRDDKDLDLQKRSVHKRPSMGLPFAADALWYLPGGR